MAKQLNPKQNSFLPPKTREGGGVACFLNLDGEGGHEKIPHK